ncbi:hypothetical protein CMI37_22280, partial [Candidatus Pacearchaeota archaeon]|nr:hypothetical protein [Candidatus Pacearchaeota archaeon]
MEHFYEGIHGWFNYQSLYTEIVNKYPSGSHFVEVGSWLGKSAAFMSVEIINSKKEIRFDCVDAWEYVQGEAALHNRIPGEQESDSGDGGPVLSLGESTFSYAPFFEPFKNLHEKFLDNIKPV